MADRYPSQWGRGDERDDAWRSREDEAARAERGRTESAWQGGGREGATGGTPAGAQSGTYTNPGSFGSEHRGYAHAHNPAGGGYGDGRDLQGGSFSAQRGGHPARDPREGIAPPADGQQSERYGWPAYGGRPEERFAQPGGHTPQPQGNTGYGTHGYGGQASGHSMQSGSYGSDGGYGSQGGYGAPRGAAEIGYGGYGPHGGGYGSQTSYASHPNYAQQGSGTQGGYGGSAAPRHPRRGPKGYTRSDERMREDICEHLMHSTHIDSSDVSVEVSAGNVLLQGTVPDRRMKHAIEDMAGACPGVNDVDNRIRVAHAGAQASAAWESTRRPEDGSPDRAREPAGEAPGEARNTDTESRGPGSTSGLSGRSLSSSSTTKPARD